MSRWSNLQEEKEELDDAPPGVPDDEQGNEIDTIMADAEAEAAAAEEVAVAPPPPPAAASGGWEADDDEDMWAVDAALGGPAAPRIEAAGEDAVAFKAANGAAARRRMRKRSTAGAGSAEGAAAGGDGGDEESKPDGALLFELQKGLGRGLSEALLMVRERGWLGAVDYRGRISDFKHNQRTMVRPCSLGAQTRCNLSVASLEDPSQYIAKTVCVWDALEGGPAQVVARAVCSLACGDQNGPSVRVGTGCGVCVPTVLR